MNQNCKPMDGVIRFPRVFSRVHGKGYLSPSAREAVFKQARFIPHGDEINLELTMRFQRSRKKWIMESMPLSISTPMALA